MFRKLVLFSLLSLFPLLLMAHGAHGNGVVAGFTHPILGVDHLAAILATGILGYTINPSKWFLPLVAFTFFMVIGGLFGIGNEATLLIEKIIAFSVFALGAIIAFKHKISLNPILVLVGIFGIFHGYAHGAEMDPSNTALKYISGYTLGTLLAGTLGMLLSRFISTQSDNIKFIHILGGVICGCGIMMLLP